jgi:hypothetical protein
MQLGIQIVPQRSPFPAVQPQRATLLRRRVDRQLGWLGTTTPTATVIQNAATAGQLVDANGNPAYIPGTAECAAATSGPSSAVVGTQIAASVAAKVAPLTGPAAPFVALGASIVGLFSSIFAAHAAAVKDEQTLLCTAVPAANQALQTIQAAVSSGQINAAAGIQALASLQAQFSAAVAPIRKGTSYSATPGNCNAACVMQSELAAICTNLANQWNAMAAQQAAAAAAPTASASSSTSTPSISSAVSSVTSAVSSVASSTGLPSWALYAAAGVALFLFFGK